MPVAENGEQQPDELFYYEGHWYLYKPPVFALPDLPFTEDACARPMQRDLLWSMRIAPQPGPLCIVTGI